MFERRKKLTLLTTVGIIVSGIVITQFVYANNGEPGTSEDPIVTLSYVEQRMEQLRFYIDDGLSKIQSNGQSSAGENESSSKLEVVELSSGERLIAGAGTEIILRSGRAVAIDSAGGGLSDVTVGNDITKDENIPSNHLLIIPRDDGRGARAVTNAIFMVRGSYEVK